MVFGHKFASVTWFCFDWTLYWGPPFRSTQSAFGHIELCGLPFGITTGGALRLIFFDEPPCFDLHCTCDPEKERAILLFYQGSKLPVEECCAAWGSRIKSQVMALEPIRSEKPIQFRSPLHPTRSKTPALPPAYTASIPRLYTVNALLQIPLRYRRAREFHHCIFLRTDTVTT